MLRLLSCALVVSTMWVSPAGSQGDLWVDVEDENGVAVLGFRPMEEPYAPGVRSRVFEWLATPDVVDKSGRVISALKFYGWTAATMTTVVVLAEVPVEGAKNQRYPDKSPDLKTVELTRYQLAPGTVQKIDIFGAKLSRTLRMTTR